MDHFINLFEALDRTTKTNEKISALAAFFQSTADDADKLWTVALLIGKRPKRAVSTKFLRQWAAEEADIPLWLFEESYAIVGDLGETIALVLPPPMSASDKPLAQWMSDIQSLKGETEEMQRAFVVSAWRALPPTGRLVFNKLLAGSFRIGVSQRLMTKALARVTGQDDSVLAHRLMGDWDPAAIRYKELIEKGQVGDQASKPYPFFLAYPLEQPLDGLGDPDEWLAERKWDGIRAQLIVRDDSLYLWSRGEELITDRFPEFQTLRDLLPDGTVIDGELLAWKNAQPLPFSALQTRIGRKTITKKVLDAAPAHILAYDLLEWDGQDIRQQPLTARRRRLEDVMRIVPDGAPLSISHTLSFATWPELAKARSDSRTHQSEGVMLKHKTSPYGAGRKKGGWWKWKVDPLTLDAVMIYAQSGHGRRANLFTDFTFAVPNDADELVPVAKAYSGLTDDEFREISTWVRRNTKEKFGPVRSVAPQLVFELAFEGIQKSSRHKSGIALRFPRMKRWRRDKPVSEINTLADLRAMLADYES